MCKKFVPLSLAWPGETRPIIFCSGCFFPHLLWHFRCAMSTWAIGMMAGVMIVGVVDGMKAMWSLSLNQRWRQRRKAMWFREWHQPRLGMDGWMERGWWSVEVWHFSFGLLGRHLKLEDLQNNYRNQPSPGHVTAFWWHKVWWCLVMFGDLHANVARIINFTSLPIGSNCQLRSQNVNQATCR